MALENLGPLEFAESILNTIREPLIVLDRDFRVIKASLNFYKTFQVQPQETEGQSLYALGDGQWDIPELRSLLDRIVAKDSTVEAFEVVHIFPVIGAKTFLLNARRFQDGNGPINAILLAMEDITERKRYEKELQRLALTDPLTGLANRNRFNDNLDRALKEARRFELNGALLLIDLDGFKQVNDVCGHPAGDAVLRDVAEILEQSVREVDTVARLGGDEFAIILVGANTTDDAERLAQQHIQGLSRPFELDGHTVTIGASIGIALFPDATCDVGELIKRADLALYQAKNGGRNTYRVFGPLMGAI